MRHWKLLLISIGLLVGGSTTQAQELDSAQVRNLLESKNYIFMARQAYPQTGVTRMLTSDYDLTVRGDTLIAFLPYFGRAYTAPANAAEGGIKFTSTKYKYDVSKKKDRWEVKIKPADVSDVQEVDMDIFDNGTARVQFINTNRQPISFDGYVVAGKPIVKRAF